jgi:hypothetical protein
MVSRNADKCRPAILAIQYQKVCQQCDFLNWSVPDKVLFKTDVCGRFTPAVLTVCLALFYTLGIFVR